jgi:hypothetical protein
VAAVVASLVVAAAVPVGVAAVVASLVVAAAVPVGVAAAVASPVAEAPVAGPAVVRAWPAAGGPGPSSVPGARRSAGAARS